MVAGDKLANVEAESIEAKIGKSEGEGEDCNSKEGDSDDEDGDKGGVAVR